MYKLNTYGRAQTISEAIRTGIVSALLIVFAFNNLMPLDDMQRTPQRTRTTRTIRNHRRERQA